MKSRTSNSWDFQDLSRPVTGIAFFIIALPVPHMRNSEGGRRGISPVVLNF